MSKKVLLFVVEGQHDKDELDAIFHTEKLNYLLNKYHIDYIVAGCDITADIKIKNARKHLNILVDKYIKEHREFTNQDFKEIIQICDTDGCFIPEENIYEDKEGAKPIYEDDRIVADTTEIIIQRNNRKTNNIVELVENVEKICNIPYSLYFVSCNMDHLLFNERNSNRILKKDNKFKFHNMLRQNQELLNETLFKEGICANTDYYDSWIYISENNNSLQRHTNFNLIFEGEPKNEKL